MVFLVFKSTAAPADAEWEDDPIPGEVWVRALGDDDEEIEPAKVVYLGQDIDDFIHVVAEDDQPSPRFLVAPRRGEGGEG